MALLKIKTYPSPVLSERASEITQLDGSIARLARDMMETMHEEEGVGIAAPQVGVSKRLIVMDFTPFEGYEKFGLIILANPEIVYSEGEIVQEEGCLSIPGFRAPLARASRVFAKGFDLQGNMVEIEGSGLLARAMQHEIDHLEGILFLEKLSSLEQQVFIRKYKKDKGKRFIGK